jgi:hypothetical protein
MSHINGWKKYALSLILFELEIFMKNLEAKGYGL